MVAGLDDPATFADAFHAATAEKVEPWYRAKLASDRHRLGEIEAGIAELDAGDVLSEAQAEAEYDRLLRSR